jgi:hypothetical protein
MTASNHTGNSSALIKAQVYSEFLLKAIHEGLLPDGFHRDVSDFADGDTLTIPVLGEGVIRDYQEGQAVKYDPIDSGTLTLTITEYVQAGTSISRKLQQDGYKAAELEAMIPSEHLRLIQERYESDMLGQQSKQTPSQTNSINGFAHRWVAYNGTSVGVINLEDFLYMKLAFDKALLPENGRVAIVDPVVEAALNVHVGSQAFTNNPQFQGLVETGFARSHRFVRNIFGWDIYVSNRLATVTETINGGPHNSSRSVTAGKANVFMCVADDMTKPFMGAWRQMPKVDGEFNKDLQQDEYVTTARWGFGLQRPQALGVVLTSATAYK